MAGVTLNFSGVENRDFDPIPNGVYEAFVHDIELREVKSGENAGAPMWAVQFAINGGPYDNRRVFRNFTLVPNSMWAVKQFLIALGISAEQLDGEVQIDTEDLIGLPCRVVVRQREYEGQIQNDVKQVQKSRGVPNADTNSSKPGADLPYV